MLSAASGQKGWNVSLPSGCLGYSPTSPMRAAIFAGLSMTTSSAFSRPR